jgi:biotin carboxyl carrier protein
MKLSLTINGAENTIEILAGAPRCRFRIGEEPEREAHVEAPEPGVYSVLMDGRSYDAHIEQTPAGAVVVVIDGYRFEIEARDPRRWTAKRGGRRGEGVARVTAPMPGKIVRVLVSVGDTVEPGRGLLVVEAMKMQNEIKAPRAGTVLAIAAREGATVAAGEVLATIG